MKKIKANYDKKDRVVCVTERGRHEFYYQPAGSNERMLLFTTNEFSGSVFAYFRDNGRNMNGRGFSLTVRELYNFKLFHNKKLTKVINRIPVMIDYVLREQFYQKETEQKVIKTREEVNYNSYCEERELAA